MAKVTAACEEKFSRKNNPPRVLLYGAGYFNSRLSRQLMDKGWTVVAVVNRAGDKIGRDWGQLTRMGRDIGLHVQDLDNVDYASLDADIAVVAMTDRLSTNIHAYRQLLNAGINVLCLGCQSYFPQVIDSALAEEIDTLATKNGVTFTGTGTWDYSRIWPGIIMGGSCLEIDSMHHASVTDVGVATRFARDSGVGLTTEEFQKQIVNDQDSGAEAFTYHLVLQLVVHALGYEITGVEEVMEPVIFDDTVYCKGLDINIAPGISAGLRKRLTVTTSQGLTVTGNVELRVIEDHEREHMRWAIDGRPGSDFMLERRENTDLATVACLLNRIPDVINGEPGLKLVTEYGPLKSTSLI